MLNFIIALTTLLAPASVYEDIYDLILERDGQIYVADYDLSLTDCTDALMAKPGQGWSCVLVDTE